MPGKMPVNDLPTPCSIFGNRGKDTYVFFCATSTIFGEKKRMFSCDWSTEEGRRLWVSNDPIEYRLGGRFSHEKVTKQGYLRYTTDGSAKHQSIFKVQEAHVGDENVFSSFFSEEAKVLIKK